MARKHDRAEDIIAKLREAEVLLAEGMKVRLPLRLSRWPVNMVDTATDGSPHCESFNGRLRDEFLNGELFYTLKEAQILIEQWRQEYHTIRPHSSLGYRSPAPETMTWKGMLDPKPIVALN